MSADDQRSVDLTLERDGVSVRIQVDIRGYANPYQAIALLDALRSDLASLIAPPGSAA